MFYAYYDDAIDTEKLYEDEQGLKGSKTLGSLYTKYCSVNLQTLNFHNPLDDAFATQALVFSFIHNKIEWLNQFK